MNISLIDSYFEFVARAFPVQCASDDFDAFPRAQAASSLYHELGDFSPQSMQDAIAGLHDFQTRFQNEIQATDDVLAKTKYRTLNHSIRGVLKELEGAQAWKHNPQFYLRTAFTGLDQALFRNAKRSSRLSRGAARIAALPRLFSQARANLERVPRRFRIAADAMAEDCTTYLLQIAGNKEIFPLIEGALQSLKQFKGFLKDLPDLPDEEVPGPDFKAVLQGRFGLLTDTDTLFAQARDSWKRTLEELERSAAEVTPGETWQAIVANPHPDDRVGDLINIFEHEIKDLRHFFVHTSLSGLYPDCPLKIRTTPVHEHSIRAMTSYSAGLATSPMEASNFYITTLGTNAMNTADAQGLALRLRREAPFIAAHDTYPGHHLTDCYRRLTPCPVASQLELPLFYEGWAAFAESMLPEYGYVSSPLDNLSFLRRKLWKIAEAMVDIGLGTGSMPPGECLALLREAGRTEAEARQLIRVARMKPGYLLCGFVGAREIKHLRTEYADRFGLQEFYRVLMNTGQMPFHLLNEALAARAASSGGQADG